MRELIALPESCVSFLQLSLLKQLRYSRLLTTSHYGNRPHFYSQFTKVLSVLANQKNCTHHSTGNKQLLFVRHAPT